MLAELSSMESADYLVRQADFLANLDSSDLNLAQDAVLGRVGKVPGPAGTVESVPSRFSRPYWTGSFVEAYPALRAGLWSFYIF